MHCEKCGSKLSVADDFCSQCGAPNPARRQIGVRDSGGKDDAEASSGRTAPIEAGKQNDGKADVGKLDGGSNPTSKAKSLLGGKRKYAVFAAAGALLAIVIIVAVLASSAGKMSVVSPDGRVLDGDALDELYFTALREIESEKYIDAIDKLSLIPTKHKRFDEAAGKIKEASELYEQSVYALALSLIAQADYVGALDKLRMGMADLPDSAFLTEKTSDTADDYRHYLLSQLERHRSAGDYDAAVSLLETGLDEFSDDAELSELYQEMIARRDIAQITVSTDAAISNGDYGKAFELLRAGLAERPDDETLLNAYGDAESRYMSEFNKKYAELTGAKKYSELISETLAAMAVLPDNTELSGNLKSAKATYKAAVLDETEAVAANGDHKTAYELLIAAVPFLDSDSELSDALEREGGAYRTGALQEAELVYRDTGDYHAAIAVLDDALRLLGDDPELAGAKTGYENLTPVAIIKNGGITPEMPSSALVPRTREEVNEILRMLYIDNLNSSEPPVISRSPSTAAQELLKNIDSALHDPKNTEPFLTDMWGKTKIIEDKYLSYEMCSNYFLERDRIDTANVDQLFFDKPFIGKEYNLSLRAKLGTDFSYAMGSLAQTYKTWYGFDGWTLNSGEYQYNLDPTMAKSGDITHFEVNTTDDYIYFVSDADDAAILFFDNADDGQMYAQGIIADKNSESSYVSIRYIWLSA